MRRSRFDFLEIGDELPPPQPGLVGEEAWAKPAVQQRPRGTRLAVVEIVGGHGDELGYFGFPMGLCCDFEGNLYVADTWHHRVQKITPDNEVYGYGGHGRDLGKFCNPSAVAVDTRQIIYILEMGNHRVQKIGQDGYYFCTFGGRGSQPGLLESPEDICLDYWNNVIVADTGNHRIQVFEPNGRWSQEWRGQDVGHFSYPRGVATDAEGNVIVSDSGNNRLVFLDRRGVAVHVIEGRRGHERLFGLPVSVEAGPDGNLWIVDAELMQAIKLSPDGQRLTAFGPALGPLGRLRDPRSLAFAPDGDFYLSDTGNHRLLKIGYREARPGYGSQVGSRRIR